jgi:hypothetical protein
VDVGKTGTPRFCHGDFSYVFYLTRKIKREKREIQTDNNTRNAPAPFCVTHSEANYNSGSKNNTTKLNFLKIVSKRNIFFISLAGISVSKDGC